MSSESPTGGQPRVDEPVGASAGPAPLAGPGEQHGGEPAPGGPAAGGPARGAVLAVLASRGTAWGLAVVFLLAALAAGGWAYTMWSQQQTEETVLSRAETVAEQVTSFRGATIDQWVSQTQALATGEYARQVEGLFDQQLRQSLRDNQVRSSGEVNDAYVQSLDGDEATVFVLASQQSTNAMRQQPVEDQLRMEITMARVDGEWLASNVAVLGPAPAAPGGPGTDQSGGPGGQSSGAGTGGQSSGAGTGGQSDGAAGSGTSGGGAGQSGQSGAAPEPGSGSQ